MRFFNRGARWQDYRTVNPELYDLALWRAAEFADPWVEDIERESDGTIEVVFGSRGANITLGVVDSEAINLYGYGFCTLLALTIHRKTGLPLVLFTTKYENNSWSGHATVQLPDGTLLDIQGVRTVKEIQEEYRFTVGPTVHTLEQFCEIIATDEHVADPMSFVDRLEQLITEEFANLLIKENITDNILLAPETSYIIPVETETVT